MSKPVRFEFSDGAMEATEENCGIAMFRDLPEADYLDIWEVGDDGEEQHRWLFNMRERLLWMGRVAVLADDERLIRLSEREHGSFRSQVGWNPRVCVEDKPREWEMDLYIQYEASKIEDELGHLGD